MSAAAPTRPVRTGNRPAVAEPERSILPPRNEPVNGPVRDLSRRFPDETIEVDFAPTIARGGVFTPLADWGVFEKVRPDARGRSLCWPGDIDFCADARWIAANRQDQRDAG